MDSLSDCVENIPMFFIPYFVISGISLSLNMYYIRKIYCQNCCQKKSLEDEIEEPRVIELTINSPDKQEFYASSRNLPKWVQDDYNK